MAIILSCGYTAKRCSNEGEAEKKVLFVKDLIYMDKEKSNG